MTLPAKLLSKLTFNNTNCLSVIHIHFLCQHKCKLKKKKKKIKNSFKELFERKNHVCFNRVCNSYVCYVTKTVKFFENKFQTKKKTKKKLRKAI